MKYILICITIIVLVVGVYMYSSSDGINQDALEAAVVKSKKKISKRKDAPASTSPQVLAYLQSRPFFSTSTKDLMIQRSSTTTLKNLAGDTGIYAATYPFNNQYEEQGGFYDVNCSYENEVAATEQTEIKYSIDSKTKKIVSNVYVPNTQIDFRINHPLLHYSHFSTSTEITQMQRNWMKNMYYFDDTDGYTWAIEISPLVYTPKCAQWVWDRTTFAFESIPGFSYGFMNSLPGHLSIDLVRGKKMVKGTDVRFMHFYFPDWRAGNILAFNISPFEGSDEKMAPGSKNIMYAFKKSNVIYWIGVYTDNPNVHKFGDQLLNSFI